MSSTVGDIFLAGYRVRSPALPRFGNLYVTFFSMKAYSAFHQFRTGVGKLVPASASRPGG